MERKFLKNKKTIICKIKKTIFAILLFIIIHYFIHSAVFVHSAIVVFLSPIIPIVIAPVFFSRGVPLPLRAAFSSGFRFSLLVSRGEATGSLRSGTD